MAEVRNRARIAPPALRVIEDQIAQLTHLDQLAILTESTYSRFAMVANRTYMDDTHDILVTAPDLVVSFAATCSGRILSATLWRRMPTDEELILDRLEGLNPGHEVRTPPGICRFGGHAPVAHVG
jgi:hypothetical protein